MKPPTTSAPLGGRPAPETSASLRRGGRGLLVSSSSSSKGCGARVGDCRQRRPGCRSPPEGRRRVGRKRPHGTRRAPARCGSPFGFRRRLRAPGDVTSETVSSGSGHVQPLWGTAHGHDHQPATAGGVIVVLPDPVGPRSPRSVRSLMVGAASPASGSGPAPGASVPGRSDPRLAVLAAARRLGLVQAVAGPLVVDPATPPVPRRPSAAAASWRAVGRGPLPLSLGGSAIRTFAGRRHATRPRPRSGCADGARPGCALVTACRSGGPAPPRPPGAAWEVAARRRQRDRLHVTGAPIPGPSLGTRSHWLTTSGERLQPSAGRRALPGVPSRLLVGSSSSNASGGGTATGPGRAGVAPLAGRLAQSWRSARPGQARACRELGGSALSTSPVVADGVGYDASSAGRRSRTPAAVARRAARERRGLVDGLVHVEVQSWGGGPRRRPWRDGPAFVHNGRQTSAGQDGLQHRCTPTGPGRPGAELETGRGSRRGQSLTRRKEVGARTAVTWGGQGDMAGAPGEGWWSGDTCRTIAVCTLRCRGGDRSGREPASPADAPGLCRSGGSREGAGVDASRPLHVEDTASVSLPVRPSCRRRAGPRRVPGRSAEPDACHLRGRTARELLASIAAPRTPVLVHSVHRARRAEAAWPATRRSRSSPRRCRPRRHRRARRRWWSWWSTPRPPTSSAASGGTSR